jgi:hypothetical protein
MDALIMLIQFLRSNSGGAALDFARIELGFGRRLWFV